MSVNRGWRQRVRVGIAVPIALLALCVTHPAIESPAARTVSAQTAAGHGGFLRMSGAEYEDRVRAAWYGQIAGTLMGFAFEHRAAAAAFVDRIPAGRAVTIRLIQRVLLGPELAPGNAYWRSLRLD